MHLHSGIINSEAEQCVKNWINIKILHLNNGGAVIKGFTVFSLAAKICLLASLLLHVLPGKITDLCDLHLFACLCSLISQSSQKCPNHQSPNGGEGGGVTESRRPGSLTPPLCVFKD